MDILKAVLNLGRIVDTAVLPMVMNLRRHSTYRILSGSKNGLIVSLTTFPQRIDTLWIVLDSLFRQRLMPDRIVLVLAAEEFPGGLASLPQSLLRFRRYGLDVVFTNLNLYCHNKYFYAMNAYPDATIVTVDDDCYYKNNSLLRLRDLHRKYPDAVCCNLAARVDREHFFEYKYWKKTTSEHAPDDRNVALGFAGVLYPPHILSGKVYDTRLMMDLSPRADDLWLKANEIDSGIKVACGRRFTKPVTIPGSQTVSLRKTNKGAHNRNDIQWRALDSYFHLRRKFE